MQDLVHTQWSPRLLVVVLGDLRNLHGVIDDQVHELVETLKFVSSVIWMGRPVTDSHTRIFPSILIDSCSYSHTLTVAFYNSLAPRPRRKISTTCLPQFLGLLSGSEAVGEWRSAKEDLPRAVVLQSLPLTPF